MRLLLLLLLSAFFANAQSPSWDWASGAGFYLTSDYCTGIASDPAGNTYITGSFQDTLVLGSDTLTNDGTRNHVIYVAKLDPFGNFLWAKSPSGNYGADANAICLDHSGHLYVTGTYQGSIVFGSDTLAGVTLLGSFFIVKMDTSGNSIWANNASCGWKAEGKAVATDDGGNVFVTGTFEDSGIVFGANTLASNFSTDVFLVKYGTNGNVLWARGAGSSGADLSNSIAVSTEGKVFITGSFRNNINFSGTVLTGSPNGSASVFLVQYDDAGSLVWARNSGGFPSSGEGSGVATDQDGNIFITGYFNSPVIYFGNITLTNAGANDIFVVKYDDTGTVVWANGVGGANYDMGTEVLSDGNGGCYVAGTVKSFGVFFGSHLLNGQNNDVFVARYDSAGTAMWAVQCNGTLNELTTGMAMDQSGNLFVSGNFSSPTAIFNSNLLTNADPFLGSYDIFVAKLGTSAIAGMADPQGQEGVLVFPQPMNEHVEIQLPETGVAREGLLLFDLRGNLVRHVYETGNGRFVLERASLSPGVYFYRIPTTKGAVYSGKLVVE